MGDRRGRTGADVVGKGALEALAPEGEVAESQVLDHRAPEGLSAGAVLEVGRGMARAEGLG